MGAHRMIVGRDAALDSRGFVLPPVGLGSAEVVAWFEGAEQGRREYHEAAMREVCNG